MGEQSLIEVMVDADHSAAASIPIEDGRITADTLPVFSWTVFGFLLPVVALLVVYLRSPRVPATLGLAAYRDGEAATFFEAGYVKRLKSRQVAATWIGFACFLAVAMATLLLVAFLL